MSISSLNYYSQFFEPFTVQLSDNPQSRYTIVRASVILDPPIPPSAPSFSKEEVKAIPEELQEDPLFQTHTDPISFEPILDPVADKNEPKHIYERANIVRWLQTRQTSPLTRRPMTEADLIPVPELKKKINEKIHDCLLQKHAEVLEEHKEKLKHYHEVDLPRFANACRNLPCPDKVSAVATISLANSKSVSPPDSSDLLGRVSVLSNPLTSQVQSTFDKVFGTSKTFPPISK